ncbi:hypothetical protein MEO94_26490, partial [Dolichospermum sp. ST_sed9]|nr:hypothetical protein [Dolichospermum sp. ST_sed9]
FAIAVERFAIPNGKVTIDKIMNNLIFMEIKTIDYSYILYKKSPVIKTGELLNQSRYLLSNNCDFYGVLWRSHNCTHILPY